eukprot:6344528-Amphidinium_carterae.1
MWDPDRKGNLSVFHLYTYCCIGRPDFQWAHRMLSHACLADSGKLHLHSRHERMGETRQELAV